MSDWEKIRETYEVTDEGIMFVRSYSDSISYSMIIPKKTFIEAYNKYIKEATDD